MANPSRARDITSDTRTFPLALAGEGERVWVAAVNGGRGMLFKLTELGLPIGSELTVTQRSAGGPMVVARNDARIALGARMAHRVMVARVTDAS